MSLAFWRDLAATLLAFEAFLITAAVGALAYLALRGFDWLDVRVRRIIPQVQEGFSKATQIVQRVAVALALPFITLNAFIKGVSRTVANLFGG